MEDLTGKKFGKLTVIGLSENKSKTGRSLWLCKCECGGTREVQGTKLRNGNAKTCGCSRNRKLLYSDYDGKTINNWTVKKFIKMDKNEIIVLAECKCGNTKEVRLRNIVSGASKDCGCGRNIKISERMKRTDLIGKKFGKLLVLSEDGKTDINKYKYKCQCDCGNIVSVVGASLTSGHTKSCGCTSTHYNYKIKEIIESTYDYECLQEYQVNLDESYDIKYFRFDIFIPELNLAIEYDGEGHFKPIDWGNQGIEIAEEQLRLTQKRDSIKNEYCKKNNIELLRISYLEKDNLEELVINKINTITCND